MAKQQQTKFPAAPPAKTTTPSKPAQAAPAAFDFATPSPDDTVLAAQRGEASGSQQAARPTPAASSAQPQPQPQRIHLPQSRAVMGKPAPPAHPADAAMPAGAAGAAAGMDKLSLGGAPAVDAGAAAIASRKRMNDYVMEADLEK